LLSGITVDDFIDGIAAGLILSDVEEISGAGVDIDLVEAFKLLVDSCPETCEVRFHLQLNLRHHTTFTGRIALERAVHRKVLERTENGWNILFSETEAKQKLKQLPLTLSTWSKIANKLA
jgi:hypothetical protein